MVVRGTEVGGTVMIADCLIVKVGLGWMGLSSVKDNVFFPLVPLSGAFSLKLGGGVCGTPIPSFCSHLRTFCLFSL